MGFSYVKKKKNLTFVFKNIRTLKRTLSKIYKLENSI